MNRLFFVLVYFISGFLLYGNLPGSDPEKQAVLQLWYEQPASGWMEAMPLGNGRLGVMVHGGIEKEIISLNEITMWSGQYDEYQEKPCGKEKLQEIRELFFNGDYIEGNRLATEWLSGTPHSFGSQVPAGDLIIGFEYPEDGEIRDYKRVLDLQQAIHEVSFRKGETGYKREYFCSNPQDAFVVKISADQPGRIHCVLSLDLLREAVVTEEDASLLFSGTVSFPAQGPGGVSFAGKIAVRVENGKVKTEVGSIQIVEADSVIIVADIRTDYKNPQYATTCKEHTDNVIKKNYEKIKSEHIRDHSSLFNQVTLFLGGGGTEHLPTDIRRQRVKQGNSDEGLDALFFQYARYLLIASSRKNSPLPANLQGVWNDNLACNMIWTNDYHLDINTQQNYWLSNSGNLAECNYPLFGYIEDLAMHGRKTARQVYGARGWTAHTVANVWGYTAPGSGVNWGLFPTASSWIASHLWTHYCYTQDEDFLRNTAYPLLKENALFLLDYMTEDPHSGYWMTGPSTSPENAFLYEGQALALSMMPTCDRQLVYETFSSCVRAAALLDTDPEFRDSLNFLLEKLPPVKTGKNGAIQEWFEDHTEAIPNHRHTTHLLGLYPFSQITLQKTPELAKAAAKTIEYRLAAEGWEDVEWSRANLICNYARLKEADKAYESLGMMHRTFTGENLLTISPEGIAGAPYDIFIFDGNEAAAAGIVEMLLQCHEGYIEFLPALPEQWQNGHYSGLCVKGGAQAAAAWENGQIKKASLRATCTNTFSLKVPVEQGTFLFYKNGKRISIFPDELSLIEVNLHQGDDFEIRNEGYFEEGSFKNK